MKPRCYRTVRRSWRSPKLAMLCPLCGPHCRCSERNAFLSGGARDSSGFDPEADDGSEERFAASLETEAEAGFESGGLLDGPVSGFSREQERGILASASRSTGSAERPLRNSGGASLASSTVSLPQSAVAASPAAPAFFPSVPMMKNDSPLVPASGTSQSSTWHDEVVSRVESYRRRRNRPRRERSLPLDFDSPWTTAATAPAAAPLPALPETVATPQATAAPMVAPADLSLAPPDFLPAENDPMPPQGEDDGRGSNLIEFPRPTAAASPIEELAEPILNSPRILDVPEEVNSVSAPLADLSLESEERPSFLPELAAIVAPVSQRLFAGALDAMMALLGTLLFAALVSRSAPQLLATRGGLAALGAASAVFWTLYHYLFLVYGRGTPGMLLADLTLIRFDGSPVPRRVLRWRALALLLSGLSLALGLLWALFDEDGLCWHDRITRSYPVWKTAAD